MNKTLAFRAAALSLIAALTAACDNDDNDNGNDRVQVDRMGRAGVNTAITDPFFLSNDAAQKSSHDANLLAYNDNDNDNSWDRDYHDTFRARLAIYDALDTDCGNQLIADATATRYDLLTTVLTDDKIYVNTESGSCQQYLAVEGNAVGISNNDCGGRTPLHDTIDTTYSVLAIGALSGVTDGVPVDPDGTANTDTFPFLDAPL